MKWLSIILILFLFLIAFLILKEMGQLIWMMGELKNKCIAECLEINKQAGQNICVC